MAECVEVANNMVETMRNVLSNIGDSVGSDTLNRFIKIAHKNIKLIKIMATNCGTIGEKNALLNAIGLLKGIRHKLKRLDRRGGSNSTQRNIQSDRLYWEDIDSIFDGRIRTGCITNLVHIDPTNFLKDCRSMFVRRMTNIRRAFIFAKVWVTFCGEFTKVSASGEQVINELKYLNTKNKVVNEDHDLNVWFNENVQDDILTQLEEFQVSLI